MKNNVKLMDFYYVGAEVKELISSYYNGNEIVECSYSGSDEELLNELKKEANVGFTIYANNLMTSILKFINKKGRIEIISTNIFTRQPIQVSINVDELTCKNKVIKCSNPKFLGILEYDMTFLAYLLNFKRKYPIVVERFRSNIEIIECKNSYKISEEETCRIIYFPFIKDMENIDIKVLPEFVINSEALGLIEKKVGREYAQKDPIYPFEEFVVKIDGFKALCKLSSDHKKIRILFRDEKDTLMFITNCFTTVKFDFTLYFYNGIKDLIPGDPREFAANVISIINLMLYYYAYYKIESEVEKVEKVENKNEVKRVTKSSSNKASISTVIIPRRVVKINKEKIATTKKRRKPIYSVKSWRRASHIRRYRDVSGKVIKEVIVKEAVCKRNGEVLLNDSSKKKVFKVSTEALNKAVKQ